MGLFDSLFGGSDSGGKLTPQESYAGILLGASACDGHIADDEVQGLMTAVVRMKLYQRMNDRQFSQIFGKVHGVLKKRGVDVLIDACAAALPKDLARPAFANAVDIVLADGVVEEDEKQFIENLRAKLNIDPETAKTIARVMVIKNKG